MLKLVNQSESGYRSRVILMTSGRVAGRTTLFPSGSDKNRNVTRTTQVADREGDVCNLQALSIRLEVYGAQSYSPDN